MFCPCCAKEIPKESRFCLACGKPIHVVTLEPSDQRSTTKETEPGLPLATRNALIGLAFFIVLVAFVIFIETGHSAAAPAPFRTPVVKVERLASGQLAVPAGNTWFTRFTVSPATMNNVRVVGRFTASGGFGNDVEAILTDEDDFENWKNGHPARALYSTGQTTIGDIDTVITAPGTYYLAFSNKFSAFANKTVSADIELRYTVQE